MTQPGALGNRIGAVQRGRNRWADWKGVGSYGTIGLEMVLSVLFGMFFGRWLDGKFDTAPYIMLVGFGFGVAAAVRALLRALREMQRQTARDGFKDSDTDRPARFALDQREDDDQAVDSLPDALDDEQAETERSSSNKPERVKETIDEHHDPS